jgi:hypothetical protein
MPETRPGAGRLAKVEPENIALTDQERPLPLIRFR